MSSVRNILKLKHQIFHYFFQHKTDSAVIFKNKKPQMTSTFPMSFLIAAIACYLNFCHRRSKTLKYACWGRPFAKMGPRNCHKEKPNRCASQKTNDNNTFILLYRSLQNSFRTKRMRNFWTAIPPESKLSLLPLQYNKNWSGSNQINNHMYGYNQLIRLREKLRNFSH